MACSNQRRPRGMPQASEMALLAGLLIVGINSDAAVSGQPSSMPEAPIGDLFEHMTTTPPGDLNDSCSPLDAKTTGSCIARRSLIRTSLARLVELLSHLANGAVGEVRCSSGGAPNQGAADPTIVSHASTGGCTTPWPGRPSVPGHIPTRPSSIRLTAPHGPPGHPSRAGSTTTRPDDFTGRSGGLPPFPSIFTRPRSPAVTCINGDPTVPPVTPASVSPRPERPGVGRSESRATASRRPNLRTARQAWPGTGRRADQDTLCPPVARRDIRLHVTDAVNSHGSGTPARVGVSWGPLRGHSPSAH